MNDIHAAGCCMFNQVQIFERCMPYTHVKLGQNKEEAYYYVLYDPPIFLLATPIHNFTTDPDEDHSVVYLV